MHRPRSDIFLSVLNLLLFWWSIAGRGPLSRTFGATLPILKGWMGVIEPGRVYKARSGIADPQNISTCPNMPNAAEPPAVHRSPVKDVVSKMKKGARRVRRFASMSHLPHIGGTGNHRRLVSLDALSPRPNPNIVPTILPPPPITTTTTNEFAPIPIPHPYSYVPPRSSDSLEQPEPDHHREYSSSSSSSSASSSELMTSNTLEVVGEEPEKVQQLVEEDTRRCTLSSRTPRRFTLSKRTPRLRSPLRSNRGGQGSNRAVVVANLHNSLQRAGGPGSIPNR
ncbi:hypothetical protein CPB85DRAFT_365228 [Mucidula mucida]|nr:hypothetical protein CPB85DRAFT_365228 [Mucidula mucida]